MEFFKENWLQIIVGVYLLGMVLYGHYRGLIRLAVSMTALAVTLAAVHFALPYVGTFIRDKTPVYGRIMDSVSDVFGISEAENIPGIYGTGAEAPDVQVPDVQVPDVQVPDVQVPDAQVPDVQVPDIPAPETEIPDAQRRFIEEMPLPDALKELLIENNNDEVYQLLGVDAFAEYIGNYLANVIVNLIGFVILFVVIYITLKLLAGALNLVAKLPVLSGINQIAGALLGGLEGLFFLWLAFLPVTAFSASSWASAVLEQIEASPWLSFLYHYNPVSRLALGIVKGILS